MNLPMIKATYRARACGAASFAPAKSGNMQIALPVRVSQGDHDGETITWIAVFHDTVDKNGLSGADRIVESLQFMGWKGDDLAELAEISDERVAQLLPDEIDIVCEPDTYDGKTNLKVKWINKPGSGRFTFKEPIKGGDLKSFAAQMRGSIRSTQQGTRQARPSNGSTTTQHPNAPVQPKDDIPF